MRSSNLMRDFEEETSWVFKVPQKSENSPEKQQNLKADLTNFQNILLQTSKNTKIIEEAADENVLNFLKECNEEYSNLHVDNGNDWYSIQISPILMQVKATKVKEYEKIKSGINRTLYIRQLIDQLQVDPQRQTDETKARTLNENMVNRYMFEKLKN